jgi:hypothetical protein
VPGKDFGRTSVVEFFRSGQEESKNKAASGKEKLEPSKMTFTGTLIEDLMSAVERAEQKAQSDAEFAVSPMLVEPWFASAQKNTDYDPTFLGVA